jgi:hypothetical protein
VDEKISQRNHRGSVPSARMPRRLKRDACIECLEAGRETGEGQRVLKRIVVTASVRPASLNTWIRATQSRSRNGSPGTPARRPPGFMIDGCRLRLPGGANRLPRSVLRRQIAENHISGGYLGLTHYSGPVPQIKMENELDSPRWWSIN